MERCASTTTMRSKKGWDQRADVLPMEGEERWSGSGSSTEDGSVAGGEHAPEAACSGADPRQGDVAGCALIKMVNPSRRGPMVERLAESYLVSERRACRVVFKRDTYATGRDQEPTHCIR